MRLYRKSRTGTYSVKGSEGRVEGGPGGEEAVEGLREDETEVHGWGRGRNHSMGVLHAHEEKQGNAQQRGKGMVPRNPGHVLYRQFGDEGASERQKGTGPFAVLAAAASAVHHTAAGRLPPAMVVVMAVQGAGGASVALAADLFVVMLSGFPS